MGFEIFILSFLAMILVGTLAITGWYLITRGEYEVQPDNTIKKTGNIFKGFYFFFIKERKGKRKVYYSGRQLELLFENEIRPMYPTTSGILTNNSIVFRKSSEEEWLIQKAKIEDSLNIKFDQSLQLQDADQVVVWVYAEFPNYIFPEWIRDPIAVCPTCMASVYGSITYWSWLGISREGLFAWSDLPLLASLLFWIAFCFSLSVTNTYIAKKVRK